MAKILWNIFLDIQDFSWIMPHQRIGFKDFIKVCDTNKFDMLITDWDAVEDEFVKIEETGVKVVVVDKE